MGANSEVDAWFAGFDHPLKEAMIRTREIILNADSRIEESIKWKTPTFSYKGNLASFNPRSKAHVSLLFHTGAHIPGDHPRLEGDTDTARTMRLADMADVEASKGALEAVVRAWRQWKDAAKT